MVKTAFNILAVCLIGAGSAALRADDFDVWPVDPLTKVFRDALPKPKAAAHADVARGEHATLQVVVRTDAPLTGLRATLTPLANEAGDVITRHQIRFVGYVPVDRPMHTLSKDRLRLPPADFPDPLLEVAKIDVGPYEAQPIWITVPISTKTPPGLYRGELTLNAKRNRVDATASIPVEIRVFNVTIDRTRLWVTNWFNMNSRHMAISPKPDSPEYWQLLQRYARNMAEHRQNVILISPLRLTEFSLAPDGKLSFDFDLFDRWVAIFQKAGVIGRIEGGHFGRRSGGWDSAFVIEIRRRESDALTSKVVDPTSPEADRFCGQFLPALVNHLREKGWLNIYVQHLADEPTAANIDSYRALANLVQKHAPGLPIIEACHATDLAGSIDIWVPQLNHLQRNRDHYLKRQKAGDELWFYTCIYPQGEYANRFIELPLIKTRLLHWINFRFGVTGYLHWGYNSWTNDDPFRKTTRPHGHTYLPAGDPWIVYPGKTGPLDSIRWEAMRDGIVDHELLSRLAERNESAARKLVAEYVLDFDRYNTDVTQFRATRRELLERLSESGKE